MIGVEIASEWVNVAGAVETADPRASLVVTVRHETALIFRRVRLALVNGPRTFQRPGRAVVSIFAGSVPGMGALRADPLATTTAESIASTTISTPTQAA